MNISLAIIFGFLLFSLYLGIRARKGEKMDLEQWAVGGRKLGTVFVFFLLAGEAYTTFTFLGGSGFAYAAGGPSFYIFNAAYFVLSYWLLPPIWQYAKEHKLLSQSDFFAHKYKSTALGVIVAIAGVIAMIPYIVLQLKGLGIIVSEASYGAISPTAAIWIGLIAVTTFVIISGLNGSAWTAVLKDILILIVVIFIGTYLPYHYYGGFQAMFEAVHAAKPDFITLPDAGLSTSWFVSTLVLWTFGVYMWPHIFPTIFASKSKKAIKRNAIIMPLYQIVLVFVIFVGFAAVLQVPGLENTDLALFELAKKTFDPWFVGVIGAAGILAALIPSSVLLLASATIISKNIFKVVRPNTSDQALNKLTRYLVVAVALASLFFTFNGANTIVTLLLMGYSLVTQLFPALFFSLLKRNPVTKQGAIAGILTGIAAVAYITISGQTIGTIFPSLPQALKDFDVGIIALLVNLIFTFAVSAFTKDKNQNNGKVINQSAS
ncbi:sodium:solute symporter family protein [Neobacillus kokaensis]|uniref:Symporter YhjB n=1 Tax=Neobacillus kokaensis TaxID=2759023 RepID=A0ABQ3N3V0_9BACI|nr:sodium:solute symporter family protein [Neobacillus kokaensis]GHH99599.1 putative symporter YhjB [Neobacillus kokaensis]